MKKVGIMTWYYGTNYGAKAQAYALQQVIKSLGYECFIINYKPSAFKRMSDYVSCAVYNKKLHPIKCIRAALSYFKRDSSYYLYNETAPVKSPETIDNLGLDCIVLGSDAIFNQRHPNYKDIYYGVGINKTKKITFSPSCEYLSPDTDIGEECKKSLLSMSSIAVRDENTRLLVKNNTGIDSVITLDPTILYDFKDINKPISNEKYILVYCFSSWEEYGAEVREYAKARGLKIIALGKKLSWADISLENADIEEWITAFRACEAVFTDSFHGTVFAIKNKKDFVLWGREDKAAKINSLLKDAGIKKDFYTGREGIEEYINNKIDYSSVENRLKPLIDKSIDYIKGAI